VTQSGYIIRGGLEGRERLRLITRVLGPTTTRLLDDVGVPATARCLDVGCGGGDVTLELGRRAGKGLAVGLDADETKLELAGAEAVEAGVENVRYRGVDVVAGDLGSGYDLVYARFLLTHMRDPAALARRLVEALAPAGTLVVEDIDYSGSFCEPPSAAYNRYCELYRRSAQSRGVDPDIGPRLPGILDDAGCVHVRSRVVQLAGREPSGAEGQIKLVSPITMEAVADVVLRSGLATAAELAAVTDELYRLASDPRTLMSIPRIVQAWGRAPG
jgi:SAM-dependent methyltransferase